MSDQNSKIVIDGFIGTVLNDRQYHRASEFMHPQYVKHFHDGQPDGDMQAFLDHYKGLVSQFPNLKSVIKKSIASGDEVWLWTVIEGLPEGLNLEIVEICRVEDGLVREKWDVHQQQTK